MSSQGEGQPTSLREVWPRETDFCDWLSKVENIVHLQNALEIVPLRCLAREVPLNGYRADLLCEICGSTLKAVVEVQFTSSDHKHLGQLATYGSTGEAIYRIWIAPSFHDSHLEAIKELNARGGNKSLFFAVTVAENWEFHNEWVPTFRVVAAPMRWQLRHLQKNKSDNQTRLFYATYWKGLKDQFSGDAIISTMHDSTGRSTIFECFADDFRLGTTACLKSTKTSIFLLFPMDDHNDNWMAAIKLHERKIREEIKKHITDVSDIKFLSKGYEQSAIEVFSSKYALSSLDSFEEQFSWIRNSLHAIQRITMPYLRDISKTYEF